MKGHDSKLSPKEYGYLIVIIFLIVLLYASHNKFVLKDTDGRFFHAHYRAFEGREGRVVDVEDVPGTDFRVAKVFFDNVRRGKERVDIHLGAMVHRSQEIEEGDLVRLVEIAYFGRDEGPVLWARLPMSEDLPFELRPPARR